MDIADLRVALFSGNYNYVRDGANQALNRLVDYLLRQGARVRVYAPVVERAAFSADRRPRRYPCGADSDAQRVPFSARSFARQPGGP